MSAIEPIVRQIKEARSARKLSQRALSAKAGLPQGHISRIEAGEVDLKLSSLVGLARALDLEPMLVPRQRIKAVDAIIRSSGRAGDRIASGRARIPWTSPMPSSRGSGTAPDPHTASMTRTRTRRLGGSA